MTTNRQITETRLTAMMRRLNIDIRQNLDLNMPVIERAAAGCSRCPHKSRCRDWLDCGSRDGYRTFCPNVIWFDLLPRRNAACLDNGPVNTPIPETTGPPEMRKVSRPEFEQR